MTPELKAQIHHVRQKLADHGDPTVGFLAPPSLKQSFPPEIPLVYQQFLREADGAACGVVILFESENLVRQQTPAKSLPGGRQKWFCFGSVEDYPLVLEIKTGAVHLLPVEGDFDPDDALGDLDSFLLSSVFGEEYADFVVLAEDDAWYQLITRA